MAANGSVHGRPAIPRPLHLELTIARCRLLLVLFALLAIYVDPTAPTVLPWLGIRGGSFALDPLTLVVLSTYLILGVGVYAALVRGMVRPETVGNFTIWADVLFAGAIASCTEGASSPFFVFFVLAVAASASRSGMRRTVMVIAVAIAIYLSLILVSPAPDASTYIMRPVYLLVVGYLIAYLGERRVGLEIRLQRLEAQAGRARIASTLHDGSLQTLIGVSLRLEGCRQLLRDGCYDEALADLCALKSDVEREYDGLRTYVRDLAQIARAEPGAAGGTEPSIMIDARFTGTPTVVDDVLQITREAIINVKRHAGAAAATVSVRVENGRLELAIDDDGVGFPADAALPWSIASRVEVAGGRLSLEPGLPGAHLRIILPRTPPHP